MDNDGMILTRAEAAILGGLLRQGYECSTFSATSVANRAGRLGLSQLELEIFQGKLGLMDALAEENGVL